MHSFLVPLISVLVVLGIMVLVHEFGHFLAAKLCGVRVEQFSIGFPPRLFGVKIGETDYCISAIPLGGYVKMTGESMPGENMSLDGGDKDSIAAIKHDPAALTEHPRWQRIIIGLAGPCANFVLALGLMTGFYTMHSEIPLYVEQPVVLDWVTPGSPAANAGFQPGDSIASYDSQPDPTWEMVNVRSAINLNHSVQAVVLRKGVKIPLTLSLPDDSKGKDFSLAKIGLLPVTQPGPVKVSVLQDKAPAALAGIEAGDSLDKIDGHAFHATETIISYLQAQKGAPLTVDFSHNGTERTVTLQPRMDTGNGAPAWRIGFSGSRPPSRVEHLPIEKAFAASIKFNRDNSLLILEVLKRVLTHKMSVDTLSGRSVSRSRRARRGKLRAGVHDPAGDHHQPESRYSEPAAVPDPGRGHDPLPADRERDPA